MTGSAAYEEQEITAIRWGGLAAMVGSLSLVIVFIFLAALVGLDTLEVEAEIQRYPDIRRTRVLENVMYLLAIALWPVHTAALFLALRKTSLASAMVGCVFMGFGLLVLGTGAIPHSMTDPISDLYHVSGASSDSQAVLVMLWYALQAIVDTLVITGLALTPIDMGCLGPAMLGHPHFRPLFGWMSLLFAMAGAISAISILLNPSDMAAIGIFALVFFNVVVGWRTFRLPASEG